MSDVTQWIVSVSLAIVIVVVVIGLIALLKEFFVLLILFVGLVTIISFAVYDALENRRERQARRRGYVR